MKTDILLRKLSKRFPKRIAKKNHDRVGLMVGKKPETVQKILLCLDLDWSILPQVKEIKPDVIITHHPFIFGTKSFVLKIDESKRLLCEELAKLNMPVYSFHTNFDEGKGGMNDALAKALGLDNVYAPIKDTMMRIGELKEAMPVLEFSKYAKEKFNISYGLLVDSGNLTIKKVGIIGGGGSRSYSVAKGEGCDIYISGDAPHYVRRAIIDAKFNYLDLPHEIEKIFMPTMKNILLDIDASLDVVIVDHEIEPQVI